MLVEVLVGLSGSCQKLAQRPGDGQVFDVGRQGLASYHSAHSWDQIRSHSLRLQHTALSSLLRTLLGLGQHTRCAAALRFGVSSIVVSLLAYVQQLILYIWRVRQA